MGKKSIRDCRDFGLEFYVYLKQTRRTDITERHLLDDIYNGEFRNGRHGVSFGSVLYGLSCFEKLKVKHGTRVIFLNQINNLKWSQPSRVDVADKKGIEIYSDRQFEDGKISFEVDNNSELTVPLYIENTGNETVHFIDYAVLRGFANFSLEVEYNVHKKHPLDLPPRCIHEVEAKYSTCGFGVESVMLAFEFKLERSSTSFYIVRFIEAKCKTTLGRNALNRPLSPPTWTPSTTVTIDGQLPESLTEKKQTNLVSLYEYKLPKDMNHLILALKKPGIYWDQRQHILETSLSNNYEEKLHLLLHLEEYQMERDIRRYNIPNDDQQEVMMERDPFNKELLILKITAENRPSLMKGDQLLAYPVEETKKKYQGYVHSVQQDNVKLGFNRELLDIFVKGMKFHIEFRVNRLNLRTQHRAAEFAVRSGLAPVLFPVAPPSPAPQQTLPDLKLFDKKLQNNPEQYRAVQNIVAGSSKPAPYLVFGPPGTGKTVTMVEAIKQIVKCQPQSCILVCAYTNKIADHLCQSLLMDVESKVIRIYAKNYSPQDVPDNLKACSNLAQNHFEFPKDIKDLKSVNITTLLTSSRFVTNNFAKGHFTHVFVDGAEQAEEPKCILPLAGLLHPETGQVVLAGDPKQLGPIIKSPFARRFCMGVSLLERLMTDFPLYQKTNGVLDNRFVTELLRNYRSHPAILKIPNEFFYDGELQACADNQCNSCCLFGFLPQKGFPIIFHGVTGSDSDLLFNTAEVDVLMDYVMELLQTQGKNGSTISPQDIGIITPYWRQVKKICVELEKVEKDYKIKNMSILKVGTLEEFQGQERRVILVSTVCTSWLNDKWFNVAVNRAKALLIIVGNPWVSNLDSSWAHFISYCKEKGGYRW
ncbi:hypothetical protein NL108_001553 [Boleophthalmus pectinirostris]|uniref:putative helicase mov-10-B.1 isoform X2 n=1 Tax=Boleophthalmus pectinirostris TaxID=150288 RepID=UPI00242D51A5|nr:putative helicase mov-10-B.1 isoform X2 [Boleophthalmus pectinirostris]KAJ0064239.1 hypothetical protein NL108_001553 [Boleophthalmus pectinirostris]